MTTTARKPVRVPIGKLADIVLSQATTGQSAIYLHVSGNGFAVAAHELHGAWLAVSKRDLVNEDVTTKRAAERAARRLINQAADHLKRYPNLFGDSIARVKEG